MDGTPMRRSHREWQVGDSVAKDIASEHVEQLSYWDDHVVNARDERHAAVSLACTHFGPAAPEPATGTPSTEEQAEDENDEQVVHNAQ